MTRASVDRAWFGAALALLACGFAAWWLDVPGPARWAQPTSPIALWLATGVLALGWWWWASAEDPADRWATAPLTLAVSASLSMVPVADPHGGPSPVTGLAAAGLAVVPLAVRTAARVTSPVLRRRTMLLVAALAVAGVAGSWLVGQGDAERLTRGLRWAAVAATTLVPAVVVAWELLGGPHRTPMAAQRRSLAALFALAVGVLPAIAALALTISGWPVLLLPLAGAAAMAVVLGRFAVAPLARVAANASGQRDRIVAVAESERRRLALALHDGPLAEVTLLIQRLDLMGDAPSATIARSIADELRGLGSELRLPILDDLGAGPALEWLTARLSQRSGVTVGLQQTTIARPPAPVELTAYRVAQEALVNALKHGSAPITVRYTATQGRLLLCVDDAGPGMDRDAPARAERDGRLGLVSMAQRAEAIGARLVLATGPKGGTQVRLEWQAP